MPLPLAIALRAARAERGLALRAIARETDYTYGYLHMLESGHIPLHLDAERIAKAYGIPEDLVWLGVGRVPPDILRALQQRPKLLVAVRRLLDRRSSRA